MHFSIFAKYLVIQITIWKNIVATLALSSRPRQRACKGVAKTKPRSRIFMPPRMQKSVRERTLTLPSELPCWELSQIHNMAYIKNPTTC